jgi:hypothetical protein
VDPFRRLRLSMLRLRNSDNTNYCNRLSLCNRTQATLSGEQAKRLSDSWRTTPFEKGFGGKPYAVILMTSVLRINPAIVASATCADATFLTVVMDDLFQMLPHQQRLSDNAVSDSPGDFILGEFDVQRFVAHA